MRVNQAGDEVFRETFYGPTELSDKEAKELLLKLIEHLGLRAVKTNATKHGNTEIVLEKEDESQDE
jgi:CO dehydrogenase/acetyl-CoA synthase epsilon subunit